MAEVGILNLTIHDNSETAAKGLNSLAGALRRVKAAVNSGINLANGSDSVAGQIKALTDQVNNSSTVVKNLRSLYNAISKFSNLGNISINTQPITALKDALGDGINIGKTGTELNKLRNVLAGDWGAGNAATAANSMNAITDAASRMSGANTASVIGDVTNAIKEYVSASKQMTGAQAKNLSMHIGGGTEAKETIKEVNAEMDAMLQKTTDSIQRVSNLADTVNNTKIGFGSPVMLKNQLSDFVDSPLQSLTQRYLMAGEAAETYGHKVSAIIPALREQRDLALGVESKKDFAGYQRQSAEQLVEKVHEAVTETKASGEAIRQNLVQPVKDAESEIRPVAEQIKQDVTNAFGTGSIKPIYENVQFGPVLAGFYGAAEQLKMMQQIAKGTGMDLNEIWRQLKELSGGAIGFGDGMKTAQQTVQESAGNITSSISQTVNQVKSEVQNAVNEIKTTGKQNGSLIPIDQFVESYSHVDYLKNKVQELKNELASKRKIGLIDSDGIDKAVMKIRGLQTELEKYTDSQKKVVDAQEETNASTFSLSGAYNTLKSGIEKMFPTLTGLIKQFARMAKMRAIRYIIRQIAQGFKEGVQHVYEYSKAVGSDFAPSMDSAASSLAQMKNALGASLAPLLQSLIPVLKNVVNWFINLSNYVNQFFSLMRGQTSWVRALPVTTEAFKKQEKAAKSTGAAIKDLLADWDELNIIQGDTSGAGSGAGTSAAEDYLSMFETVTEFDKKVKDLVGWIQEHMEEIKAIAAAIGAAILMWKFSSAFLMGISELAGLATLGVISLAVGLQLTWAGAYAAGKKGEFDTTALLETAGGMLLSTIGGALIGYTLGGPWGAVIGAATGLVASIAVAVKAYYDGERSRKLAEKWGTLHLTDEEIQELVGSQVTAKVQAALEITSASVSNRKQAKAKADRQIQIFSRSLETAKFSLDTDASEEGISSALASAKEAIEAIQASLDADREGLKLSFTKFTYRDKEGNDITSDLYSNLMKGNLALDKFFTQMGDDIAYYISKGFEEGLDSREYKMAMELMNSMNSIVNTAEKNYEANKFIRENKTKMDNAYDMETAQKIFDEQNAKLAEYRNTTTEQMKEDLDSYYRSLEYFKAVQEHYADTGDTAKVEEYAGYIEDTQTAIDNMNKAIEEIKAGNYDWMQDETYAGMVYRMKEMWEGKLKELYKDAYYKYLFGEDTETSIITPNGEVKKVTQKAESPFMNNPTAYNIMHGFGISESSWLTPDDISEYVTFLIEKYNGDQRAAYDEAMEKLPIFKGAMVDMYFPDLVEEINGIEPDKDTKIRDAIYAMYLSGVAEGSERWKTMVSAGEEAYGKDQFDAAIEQYKNLGSAYLRMIEDMNYGMPSEDFIARNKYAEDLYPGFVKQFMDYFSDRFTENDKNAPNIPGSKAETIEPIKKSVDAINSLGDWWENVNKEFTEWTSGLPFFYKPPEEITEVTEGAVVKIDAVDVVIEDPDGLRKELEEQVEYLLMDSRLEDWERNALNNTYGEELVNKVLKEMYYTFDEEGYLTGKTKLQQLQESGMITVAAAGIPSGGYNMSRPGVQTPVYQEMDEEDKSAYVANGTKEGTSSLLEALNSILSVAQAINRKEFTVNITPTSTMGSVMSRSLGLYGQVTGD